MGSSHGFTLCLLGIWLITSHGSSSTSLYVSPDGHDSNDGSRAQPLRTIQRCHDLLHRAGGGLCLIGRGIYRETVHLQPGAPIGFEGSPGAIISGLEPVGPLDWQPTSGCQFKAKLKSGTGPIEQLFYNGSMMVEARWPNIDVSRGGAAAMDQSAWRKVQGGSKYGRVVDSGLKVNFSWNGGLATLNVGHQWNSWTRLVHNHSSVTGSLEYPMDLPGLAGYDPTKYPQKASIWDGCNAAKCNQYFLSGKLEALDAPGEFFHDVANSELHFHPPECKLPAAQVEIKARDWGFMSAKATGLTLRGLTFKGATIQLTECSGCQIENISLLYPTYSRQVKELEVNASTVATTTISGSQISLRNISLSQSNNNGLKLTGSNITLDNCLIEFTDWVGSLTYRPLGVTGNQIKVTRCTVHDFGNAGVVTSIPNTGPAAPGEPQQPPEPMAGRLLEVAYTHIFNGALVGEDTAALYTGGWSAAGQHWHNNWIHDTTEKCVRGDDQSENMTIHHNVIYNCGMPKYTPSAAKSAGLGIVAKGDGHLIYANTVFNANHSELCLPGCVEKLKPFRRQFPRVEQNVNSLIFNTVAKKAVGSCECSEAELGGNLTHVYAGQSLGLTNVAEHDYRPTATSPLVDAGVVIPPYTNGYVGRAPDIGAYEHGGEWWIAGCRGMKGC